MKKEWEVVSFEKTFKKMNNTKLDYTVIKIMQELQYMKFGFIAKKWGKTTKKGTKATFVSVSDQVKKENKIESRLEELKNIDIEKSSRDIANDIINDFKINAVTKMTADTMQRLKDQAIDLSAKTRPSNLEIEMYKTFGEFYKKK